MDGWIKLHRRILEHSMLKNDPIARHIFTDMLLLASPADGSFLAGKRYLARISGFHPSTVYKVIQRLEKAGMVEPQSNHKGTRILICNWALWQPQSNHKVTVLKNKEVRSYYNTPPTPPQTEVEVKLLKFLESQDSIKNPTAYLAWLRREYGTTHFPRLLTINFSQWVDHLNHWKKQEANV